MKKVLIVYAGILAAVFIILSLFDLNGDYSLEKKLWRLNKEYKLLTQDPAATPPNAFEQLIVKYDKVIKRYPNSRLIPGVQLQVGRLYVAHQELDSARSVFQYMTERYAKNPEIAAEAMANLGRTYEIEENWPLAEKVYRDIIARYPLTSVGLNTPLYIANHYQTVNNYSRTTQAYREAVDFYKDVTEKSPDSPAEFTSLRLLANCYFSQSRWEDGVNALGTVLLKYSASELMTLGRAELIAKTINTVALNEFEEDEYKVAFKIYREFLEKYPNHPLRRSIKTRIEELTDPPERKKED